MNKRNIVGLIAVFVAVLALAVAFGGGAPVADAAPAALGTPVTVYGAEPTAIYRFMGSSLTASTNGSSIPIAGSQKVDLQTVITQATPNAVSVQLQFSNDGTNWVGGPYIVSTPNATPQNVLDQYQVFGRYGRIAVTTANSNPVTVKVIGVGK